MDRTTFDAALRTLIHHRPFRPLTVVMTDGGRLTVGDADSLAFRDGAALFMGPDRVPVLFDCRGVTQITSDATGPTTG